MHHLKYILFHWLTWYLKALNFLSLILSLKIGEICTKEVRGSPTHHWMKESQGGGRSQ